MSYDLYANGKRDTEREILIYSSKLEFYYTIMRPAVIEGINDPHMRTWFWVQRLLDGGPIFFPHTEPATIYKHVCADDVAESFRKTVDNEKAYNETFNVTGNKILSIEEYIKKIAVILEINTLTLELIPISPEELYSAIPGFEFPPFFSGTALISSIEKAKNILAFQPTPFEEWCSQTVQHLKENVLNLENSLSYEYRKQELELAKKLNVNKHLRI